MDRQKDGDFDLHDAIRRLIDGGDLTRGTPAYDVAEQVIFSGYKSLRPKQRAIYDAEIVPALIRKAQEADAAES